MLRKKLGYLWDVRDAADAILRFVEGVSFQDYCERDIVHSAVERKFEILGEELSQLRKLDSARWRRDCRRSKRHSASETCLRMVMRLWSTTRSGTLSIMICP